jgi:hypothetical protein
VIRRKRPCPILFKPALLICRQLHETRCRPR